MSSYMVSPRTICAAAELLCDFPPQSPPEWAAMAREGDLARLAHALEGLNFAALVARYGRADAEELTGDQITEYCESGANLIEQIGAARCLVYQCAEGAPDERHAALDFALVRAEREAAAIWPKGDNKGAQAALSAAPWGL